MTDPFDWREPHEAARQRDHVLRSMPLVPMDLAPVKHAYISSCLVSGAVLFSVYGLLKAGWL